MHSRNFYQIYDLVAESLIGPPLVEKNKGPAIRAFTDILADKNTTLGQHPDDYELRFIAIQDESTGALQPVTPPQTIATGAEWAERKRQEQQQITQGVHDFRERELARANGKS